MGVQGLADTLVLLKKNDSDEAVQFNSKMMETIYLAAITASNDLAEERSDKVKELKDDAIIEVKVNNSYYLMVKSVLLHLVTTITAEDKDAYIKEAISKEYKNMDEIQRSFYTVSLLLAEIEQVAKTKDLFVEKELLQPGDEGFVAPKID